MHTFQGSHVPDLLVAADDRDAEEDKFVLLDKAEAEEEEALRYLLCLSSCTVNCYFPRGD